MNPIALELGPLDIYWHSILLVGSILIAAVLSDLLARYRGQDLPSRKSPRMSQEVP